MYCNIYKVTPEIFSVPVLKAVKQLKVFPKQFFLLGLVYFVTVYYHKGNVSMNVLTLFTDTQPDLLHILLTVSLFFPARITWFYCFYFMYTNLQSILYFNICFNILFTHFFPCFAHLLGVIFPCRLRASKPWRSVHWQWTDRLTAEGHTLCVCVCVC